MSAQQCPSTYPGAATLRGKAIRCDLPAGHDGQHGHSFAARYWPNESARACPSCGHAEYGYGGPTYNVCPECDCGDPTSMVGPHVFPAY